MSARLALKPVTVLILICGAASLRAQQRPLQVEDANGIGGGNILIQVGTDFAHSVRFPLSGLTGDLWRIGLLRMDFGLGEIADLTISGGVRDHLFITSRADAPLSDLLELANPSGTGAFDDLIVATKARVLAEALNRPAIAVKVATRLPNAKHPSGLGLDTTDFFASALA